MSSSAFMVRTLSVAATVVFMVLTGLGASGLHTINSNHLGIPLVDRILGLAIPLGQLIFTLLLACGFRASNLLQVQSASDRTRQPKLIAIANLILWILSILDTVLLSTSAFALDPQGLGCNLDNTWRSWYETKDSGAIREIQDRFECCGLHSTKDKAWPFPDKQHTAHACEERFGRTVPCLDQWQGSTRRVLVTLTAIGAISLALKLLVAFLYAFMQAEDLSFGFSNRSRRNDPARRRLLDDEHRSGLPSTREGAGSYVVEERAE